jgi:hypothetical protein
MQFTLTFEWNGKLVATAQATAVMAYEFADSFFRDQFAGRPHAQWYGEHFSRLLDDLLASVTEGRRFERTLEYADRTGSAKLLIRS